MITLSITFKTFFSIITIVVLSMLALVATLLYQIYRLPYRLVSKVTARRPESPYQRV